jgi:hypothetical protein
MIPTSWSGAGVSTGLVVLNEIARGGAYRKYYEHSDHATLRVRGSGLEPRVSLLLVDGKPTDEGGFTYSYVPSLRIYLSPGPHLLVLKTAAPELGFGRSQYSAINVGVEAHRNYRLATIRRDNADVLQLWDETAGAKEGRLVTEVRSLPEGSIAAVLRKSDVAGVYALVTVDNPKRFNDQGNDYVLFCRIDGFESSGLNYPSEMFQRRILPPGRHRLVLKLQGAGLFPGLDTRTLPEFEAEFLARHFYRFTGRHTGQQAVVQLWDVTEPATEPVLVQEFHFGGGKS